MSERSERDQEERTLSDPMQVPTNRIPNETTEVHFPVGHLRGSRPFEKKTLETAVPGTRELDNWAIVVGENRDGNSRKARMPTDPSYCTFQ